MNKANAQVRYFCTTNHKLAYLQIPKAGCTSIKNSLLALQNPEHAKTLNDGDMSEASLRKLVISAHDLTTLELDVFPRHALPAGYFRFTFVRNPYARFISFWRDKLIQKWTNPITEKFMKMGIRQDMPHLEIIDRIFAIPLGQLDKHVLPQHHFVYGPEGQSYVDSAGHLESFDDGWASLCQRLDMEIPCYHFNQKKKKLTQVEAKKFEEKRKRKANNPPQNAPPLPIPS